MTMKKNNKEIKERLLKARALSDEELEQVSGGTENQISFNPPSYVDCPNCHNRFQTNHSPTTCGNCGTVFYVIIS